jgi:N,N'-diacetyllegionaminate synthase
LVVGFDIARKHVGDGAPCLIVGEVAQAHEGSYQLAHAYIDAIADAGADAVKFQCHIAEAESWPDEPWRVKPKWGSETRYEYWKRMEFTYQQWKGLGQHAHSRGLAFIVSPFSADALDLAEGATVVDAWKVPSGEVGHARLLGRMKSTRIPVLLSTGMSDLREITTAVETFMDEPESTLTLVNSVEAPGGGVLSIRYVDEMGREIPHIGKLRNVALLQCTSAYPCPPGQLGLNNLDTLRMIHRCPVGLSDHSGSIYAGLAAVALGCDVLEVHVTLSRDMPGPDTSSSITTQELKQLVEGVRFIEKAKQPVDKDAMAMELQPMRDLFMNRHKRRGAKEMEDACRGAGLL